MATKKKKTSPRSSKSTKKPARKASPSTKSKKSKTAGPRERKLESVALKLVDEAAATLRKSIRTGASTTEKARLSSKKKAHSLLSQASASLSDLLGTGTSALQKAIGKL